VSHGHMQVEEEITAHAAEGQSRLKTDVRKTSAFHLISAETRCPRQVRLGLNNGLTSDIVASRFRAITRLMHCSKTASSFDELVGALEERLSDCQPERLGGLKIDHQREFGRLLNGKVGRLGALQNPVT
jgi:hypothetical protein